MALDQNLFTLKLEPSKSSPDGIDLVEPSGVVHYRKVWVPNNKEAYCFSVCDPLSESVLATVTAPSATSKQKLIELHNPSVSIHLNYTGLLSFKWTFTWEGNQFDWKREECYMIRKPDPPVLIAVTKEPPGKIKTSTVQILDYNIQRFDIQDRKGLEIAILTALLTFPDYSEQLKTKPQGGATPLPQSQSAQPLSRPQPSLPSGPPPPPPPKPDGWIGDKIAILQAEEQRDINEVVVGDVGTVDDYVKHCVSLLSDETLLYITLRSQGTVNVSKVVQVAEATKRSWYKTSGYDEELHQYVNPSFDDPELAPKKGRRVINLDDPPINSAPSQSITPYTPPNSLAIHLSKISMPELEPKATSRNPRLVVREPSPTRKHDKEKHERHGHHKSHKHHASELNIGSAKMTGLDTKGRSHHSHASQDLTLLRSSSTLSPNSYTSKLSPIASEPSSSSHRPNLKISPSLNGLKASSTRKHSPRPLPVSPASASVSSAVSSPGGPSTHYRTVYPERSLPSPAPAQAPSRGSFWKRR